jgi:hypothetical protein
MNDILYMRMLMPKVIRAQIEIFRNASLDITFRHLVVVLEVTSDH